MNVGKFLLRGILACAMALGLCGYSAIFAATATVNNAHQLAAAINDPNIDTILLAGPAEYDLTLAAFNLKIDRPITFRSADETARSIKWNDPTAYNDNISSPKPTALFSVTTSGSGTSFGNINFNDYLRARETNINAANTVATDFNGGIFNINNASVKFGDVVFSNNEADLEYHFTVDQPGMNCGDNFGGLIYFEAADKTNTMTFDGKTTFDNNTFSVKMDSVPIWWEDLKDMRLKPIYGGVIYSKNGNVRFNDDLVFSGNQLLYDSGMQADFVVFPTSSCELSSIYGSLIYSEGSNYDFYGATRFESNLVKMSFYDTGGNGAYAYQSHNGLIYKKGGEYRFHDVVVFENNMLDFLSNTSVNSISYYGGLIHHSSGWGMIQDSTMTFEDDVYFLNNTSPNTPAGLCVFNDRRAVINFNGSTYFHNNHSTQAGSYGLGVAINNEGILSLNGYSEFIDNGMDSNTLFTGGIFGGAIYNTFSGTLNFNATSLLIDNYIDDGFIVPGIAEGYGGAIYNYGNVNFNLTKPGDYVLFRGNRDITGPNAITLGGAGNLNFNNVMGTDVYFYDPISNRNSGAPSIFQNSCGTVHFIGAGNDSEYDGTTNINKGYFQLEEGATYGIRDTNFWNILTVGQNGSLSGDGTFRANEIHIDGTLLPGFYMDKGYYSFEKGKTLELDGNTLNFGANSVYKPALWADGSGSFVSATGASPTIDPDATMFLNFRPDDYTGTVTYAPTIEGFTQNQVLHAPFIAADYDSFTGVITSYGFVPNYFANTAITKNQKKVAPTLDSLIGEDTDDEIWDYLTQTAIAYERFGDPALLKFFDAASGAQRANTMMMATMFPKDVAWKQIGPGLRYNGSRSTGDETLYRFQNSRRGAPAGYGISSHDLWFQPHYQSLRVGGDGNCGGYSVDQAGFVVGNNKAISPGSYYGVFAGYASPEMKAEDYYAKADNMVLGSLFGRHFQNHWELKTWGVAGYQHYNMRRAFDKMSCSISTGACIPFGAGADYDKTLRGKTDGWSLATGFELGKVLAQRPGQFSWLRYRPFFGFDYEHVSQSGFSERGGHPMRLNYLDENFDRTQFHFGASALINTRFCSLDGRIMYTNVIGGDAGPSSGAEFATMPGGAFTVDGVNLGYHYLNLGVNGDIYLNAKRSKILTCAFETSFGRHSQYNVAALTYSHYY